MRPLRMCMVCRKRKEKEQLLRVARSGNGVIAVDSSGKMPGRGAYLCKSKECLISAQKRKVLERAFSQKVNPEIYSQMCEIAEAEDER